MCAYVEPRGASHGTESVHSEALNIALHAVRKIQDNSTIQIFPLNSASSYELSLF
jgi:hypothetical protein